jgi:1-acyl-sn-glycerol-3-phosphate acyltransferase
MLYSLLKTISRFAIRIFCRKILVNQPTLLKSKGPLLIAFNHPNSFLDSIILNTLFDQPVWSLARGDAFKKPGYARLLRSMKMMPVYRVSEGAENLPSNYQTFDDCTRLFKQDALISISSEGKCINEWKLRPIKKGTARLALKGWRENIPVKVLPVGLNYSSFRRFGKNVFLNFGEPITMDQFDLKKSDGFILIEFTNKLNLELKGLVFEIPSNDHNAQQNKLEIKESLIKKAVLAIPAALGFLIHWPLYQPVKTFTWKRTRDNDHYDSVMTGILFLIYPVYVTLLMILTWFITKSPFSLLVLLLFPFTAWSLVQLKPQLDKS